LYIYPLIFSVKSKIQTLNSESKKTVLYIYPRFSSFVKNDYESLSKEFNVVRFECKVEKKIIPALSILLKEKIFLLKNIRIAKAIVCWFADYHSFLPALFARIFRKKFFIINGGYDVMYIPEINYGSFNSPFRGFITKFSLQRATYNLAVSPNLIDEAKKRVPKGKYKLLPTAHDSVAFNCSTEKENIIITVAGVSNLQRFKIKGLDRFVELAHITPELEFVIIGSDETIYEFIPDKPKNLRTVSHIPFEELTNWYSRAKFYAQFSRSEGLPSAVCEAMLSECIPVGIRVGGIPFAINKFGILANDWNPELIKEEILKNMSNSDLGKDARSHIVNTFNSNLREKAFNELINN